MLFDSLTRVNRDRYLIEIYCRLMPRLERCTGEEDDVATEQGSQSNEAYLSIAEVNLALSFVPVMSFSCTGT